MMVCLYLMATVFMLGKSCLAKDSNSLPKGWSLFQCLASARLGLD